MTQEERRRWLIDYLLAERTDLNGVEVPPDAEGQRELLRALFNVRMPEPVGEEFLRVQDSYLQERAKDIPGAVGSCIRLTPGKALTLYQLLYEILEE